MQTLILSELINLKDRAQKTQLVLTECISIYDKEIEKASVELFKDVKIPKAFSQYKVIEKIIFVLKSAQRELSPQDICLYMSILDKNKWRRDKVSGHIGMYVDRTGSKGLIARRKEKNRVYYRIR